MPQAVLSPLGGLLVRGDALVELAEAVVISDAKALSQHAQARQALVEIATALAAMKMPTALALQERIKQLR